MRESPRGAVDGTILVVEDDAAVRSMLSEALLSLDVRPLIRHHHERWDGSGYPAGLLGEAIPPGTAGDGDARMPGGMGHDT